ncbi:unnamed protein product, partial [Laminaria digitata]
MIARFEGWVAEEAGDRTVRRRFIEALDEVERPEKRIEELKAMEECPSGWLARTEQRLALNLAEYALLGKTIEEGNASEAIACVNGETHRAVRRRVVQALDHIDV